MTHILYMENTVHLHFSLNVFFGRMSIQIHHLYFNNFFSIELHEFLKYLGYWFFFQIHVLKMFFPFYKLLIMYSRAIYIIVPTPPPPWLPRLICTLLNITNHQTRIVFKISSTDKYKYPYNPMKKWFISILRTVCDVPKQWQ